MDESKERAVRQLATFWPQLADARHIEPYRAENLLSCIATLEKMGVITDSEEGGFEIVSETNPRGKNQMPWGDIYRFTDDVCAAIYARELGYQTGNRGYQPKARFLRTLSPEALASKGMYEQELRALQLTKN